MFEQLVTTLNEMPQLEERVAETLQVGLGLIGIVGLLLAVVGIAYQLRQVRHASQVFRFNALAHFSNLYHQLVRDVPSDPAGASRWWYAYWDVLVAEANAFHRGDLDPVVFELWMTELARNARLPFHGSQILGTPAASLSRFKQRQFVHHRSVYLLLERLMEIGSQANDGEDAAWFGQRVDWAIAAFEVRYRRELRRRRWGSFLRRLEMRFFGEAFRRKQRRERAR